LVAAIDLAEAGGACSEVLAGARRELARLADESLAAAVASSAAAAKNAEHGGDGVDRAVASSASVLQAAVERADDAGASPELLHEAQHEMCRLVEARLASALGNVRHLTRSGLQSSGSEGPLGSLREAVAAAAALSVAAGGDLRGARVRRQLAEARRELRRLCSDGEEACVLAVSEANPEVPAPPSPPARRGRAAPRRRPASPSGFHSTADFLPPAVIGRPSCYHMEENCEDILEAGLRKPRPDNDVICKGPAYGVFVGAPNVIEKPQECAVQ